MSGSFDLFGKSMNAKLPAPPCYPKFKAPVRSLKSLTLQQFELKWGSFVITFVSYINFNFEGVTQVTKSH